MKEVDLKQMRKIRQLSTLTADEYMNGNFEAALKLSNKLDEMILKCMVHSEAGSWNKQKNAAGAV